MAEENNNFRKQLVAAFKEATKAAVAEAKGEKKLPPLENALQELVGSPKPVPFTLGNAQVIKEPLWWVLFLQQGNYEMSSFVDDFDVPGPVTIAFERSLLAAFTSDLSIPNDYVKLHIRSLVDDFLQMSAFYSLSPIDLTSDGGSFLARTRLLRKKAASTIDLLERDYVKKNFGTKEATRFMRAVRANDKKFAQRNGYAVRAFAKTQAQGTSTKDTHDTLDSDDLFEQNDKASIKSKSAKKSVSGKTKKKRY
jgi:hypothetical protein